MEQVHGEHANSSFSEPLKRTYYVVKSRRCFLNAGVLMVVTINTQNESEPPFHIHPNVLPLPQLNSTQGT